LLGAPHLVNAYVSEQCSITGLVADTHGYEFHLLLEKNTEFQKAT